MNPTQKARLLRAISKGANTEGTTYDGDGGYCIMGELARELGATDFELHHNAWPHGWESRITEAFGLSRGHMDELMHINDSYESTSRRREALRKYVERNWGHVKVAVRKTVTTAQKQATKLIHTLSRQKEKVAA